jgi:hypothetical protein
MANNIDGKGVTVSVKIYERLLAAYPAGFRREYGPAMKQLFRDQCRDAWDRGQGRGLAVLWLRVLPDLAKTSLLEHLAILHRRESMCRKILRAFRAFRTEAGLRAAFGRWFTVAFVCMLGFSICQTFWTPKIYSSTTRIEVRKDAPVFPVAEDGGYANTSAPDPYFLTTQFKIIESWSILTNVIATLHLADRLAAQAGETHWTMDQTYAALFNNISIKRTRMTRLIEISVKNRDPKLAADIANAIVGAYRESRLEKWKGEREETLRWNAMISAYQASRLKKGNAVPAESTPVPEQVTVRDPARPIMHPIQSGADIILMWMSRGTLAALAAGGAGAWLAYLIRGSSHRSCAPS